MKEPTSEMQKSSLFKVKTSSLSERDCFTADFAQLLITVETNWGQKDYLQVKAQASE